MKLIAQFGTIEELLRRVEEVTPPRIKALLIEQAENARLSRRLATIQLDSPVTFDPTTYQIKPPHQDQLTDLLRELGFTSLLKSFQPSFKPAETKEIQIELIQDEPSAEKFVESLPKGSALGLQCLLSAGPNLQGELLGIALSTGDKTAFIPLDVRTYMRPITALLHDPTRTKVVHDLKATLLVFHRIGLTLAGPYLDTMVADYLLNPNRRDHQLETIAFEVLDHRLGPGHKENAAPQSLFEEDTGSQEEAAEAASVLATLAPPMTERLSEQGSLTLFTDVEMPLVPVLAAIERNGFLLDVDGLHGLSKELERDLDKMIKTIEGLAGGEFNINSPKQLAAVLFEKLGLKPVRKTKTGYST
ncbi:MAG: DNA polymerase, partial [Nitrospiraceae bacterium]